ncbi:MAG: bile acid:sodium symporter family protein [Lentimicrobium sp.]|jgi:sodium/bile acid cotransporter 7|nr:bile acid:sodium symporter family protein [Lentimicrobium sp.]
MKIFDVKPLSAYFSHFDWFSPALLLMILIAKLFPEPGLSTNVISLKSFAGFGISMIFFLYGLRLSLKLLWGCIYNWKLHLIVQLTTFVLFPFIVLAFWGLFADTVYHNLWLGVFFLAVLPSTVSSAVVMVSLSGGNVAAAIFNATISSIAGILITPLWMSLFLSAGDAPHEMGPVFIRLGYQIFLPLVLGILLHQWLGRLAIHYKDFTRYFDQSVILAVVYTSFCVSFHNHLFSDYTASIILKLILVLVLLFLFVNGVVFLLSRYFKLPHADLITALFCGSTKSLMHGSVMAGVLFSGLTGSGVFLLPVLIYHAMQLTISGFASHQFRRSCQ